MTAAGEAAEAVGLPGHAHQAADVRLRHAEPSTTPATSACCRHARLGEPVDHEDFDAWHRLDPRRRGFRMPTLLADGAWDTETRRLDAAAPGPA